MNWHRLFGLVLTDFFTDSPYEVEAEKDLSLQQQYLDVVVVRKHPGEFGRRLPDGLDNLGEHNLISFKSYQEAFDDWTACELIGHYVTYRKLVSRPDKTLMAKSSFRLYGVCVRFPQQLAKTNKLVEQNPGVFECDLGIASFRLIVVRDLPKDEQNAPLHLFSAIRDHVQYGQSHYQQRSPTTSTLLHQLLVRYQEEGISMPYTMEDFEREIEEKALKNIPVEKLLERIPMEKRLAGIPKERLLSQLTQEEIEAYLRKLKQDLPKTEE